MMDFLKEHATTVVALFTVVVAFGGTWLGAKVQANGGVAQARAAREAAETAAAATLQAVREQADRAAAAAHAATMHDQRTSATSNLLRTAREFTRAVHALFRGPDTGAVENAYNELIHAQGAVELVAPPALTAASARVVETAVNFEHLARIRGEAYRAWRQVRGIPSYLPEYADANAAVSALLAFRAAYESDSDNVGARHNEASAALARVPSLTPEQRSALLNDCTRPEVGLLVDQCSQEHNEAMTEFITRARTILGVND
ncbi:hypothetical protein ACFQ6O_30070 [Streptomyces sp. NPDC056441]|uniref:hypothetical protein n=1 Tax=Streptomyces sp. NPDC056441 TaxID=3345817 RepID=UPI00368F55FE